MKKVNLHALILLFSSSIFSNVLYAQNTSNEGVPPENNQLTPENDGTKQKKDKKRKDEFKIYAGVNFNKKYKF